MLAISLDFYAGYYYIFSGDTIDNVHVDFINSETGEVIGSHDSSDLSDN
jgi:hypothetical protein